jgi:lipopolysaccharide transport system permease protein
MLTAAFSDLMRSVASWRLWMLLGWMEIRQRYARSRIGPFWLTISMGVLVAAIGVVYGTLFGQNLSEYLPFAAISLIAWGLFSSMVVEGSNAYISNASYIRQVSTSKLIFILQLAWRNLIILAHNLIIIIVLFMIFGVKRYELLPLFIPGVLLLTLNAMWLAMLAGLFSARFRDFPQIIASVVQVAFYVTPVIFKPEALARHAYIAEYNPLTYLLDIVRQPLLGVVPSATTWTIAIVMAIVGWLVALIFTGRYLHRISYWV